MKLKNNSDKLVQVVLFGDAYEIAPGEKSSNLPERVGKAWLNIHQFLSEVAEVVEISAENIISREEAKERGIDVEKVEAEAEVSSIPATIIEEAPKKKNKKKKII